MTKRKWGLFAFGWVLVLVGSGVASVVQTWGGIDLRDVRLETADGTELSALLYVPPSATAESPAPAVLAVHGYINSRETQSGFAIELARRGFVVLALDQTGHGFSGGRAMTEGFGGPAGLAYLRSLAFVDTTNIGLEGHSMGGWAVLAAAQAYPDAYESVVLVGSATGPGFAEIGTPTWPRNLGVVFSRFDEFSQLMWGVQDATDVVNSEKLQGVFNAPTPIHPGQVYGSPQQGTARWLAMPNTTHPGEHLSREAIGYTVNWLSATLEGEQDIPPGRQIWFWKELGTLISLLGAVLLLLGAFELLLSLPRFAHLAEAGVGVAERMSGRWWLSLSVAALVPAVTYFPLTGWGSALAANAVLPQSITNQILVWALANGVLAIPVLWAVRRRSGDAAASGGLLERGAAAKLLVAFLSVAAVYAAALVAHWAFKTDFRFWVVALKPMGAHHVPAFLAYLLPFTAFFYATQRALHATLSLRWAGPERQYATGLVTTAGGFALMVAVLYAWLFATGHLPNALGVDVLFTVIAIQFVPVLAVTGLVAVFTWRRTNGALAGAVICGLLVTWYIVAGQATHL
ncbi:MAG TPA: alpha/beta fold hydrolase [Longimicrobiales bacterium]|nr:alpha/beta fold hydrolase [Longimicrobiales bacterium]